MAKRYDLPEVDELQARRTAVDDLFELRGWKGLAKSQWAKRARIARGTLYKIEDGKLVPTAATIKKLFNGLELTVSDVENAHRQLKLSERGKDYLEYLLARANYFTRHGQEYGERVRQAVGERISEARERIHLTQEEMARSVGVSKGLAWQIESGNYRGSHQQWLYYLKETAQALQLGEEQFYPQPRDQFKALTGEMRRAWSRVQLLRLKLEGEDLSTVSQLLRRGSKNES